MGFNTSPVAAVVDCLHGERSRGFTLIEMLVALLVFALLMVSAFQLFSSALHVNERSEASFAAENQLVMAWAVIFQDLIHVRDRPQRDIQGDKQAALETTQYELLRFVRGGYPPVAGITPGGLLRVAYRLDDDGNLIRQTWSVIDLANDSQAREQILLSGVESLQLAMLNDSGDYTEVWPPLNTGGVDLEMLPRLFQLTLTFRDGRTMTRTIPGVDG